MGEILKEYEENRDQMKTGDLLLWRSNSLLGSLIRFFSKGKVNHASLLLRIIAYEGQEKRVFTSEALEHGVVINPLSLRLQEYDGEVWWYPLRKEWDNERNAIGVRALQYLGVGYDYGSLFKNAICRVSADVRKLFCSEYYYICLGRSGTAPTPEDLKEYKWFKKPVLICTSKSTVENQEDKKKWGG